MAAAVTARNIEPPARDAFAPHELACMQSVIEAVCVELGVQPREKSRRLAVAERVMTAYRHGSRLPLNMVHAGLAETRPHA